MEKNITRLTYKEALAMSGIYIPEGYTTEIAVGDDDEADSFVIKDLSGNVFVVGNYHARRNALRWKEDGVFKTADLGGWTIARV